ncbi:unnamed protein product [Alopecurus aequalis]
MSSSKHQGGKLLSSRILSSSRDGCGSSSSVANASFRVYYSLGAGTVPFVWETKPGTPKSTVVPAATTDYDDAPPPPMISPPPSYQSRTRKAYTTSTPSPSSWPWRWGWMARWLDVRRRPSLTGGGRWHAPDSAIDQVERPRRRTPILLCSCASDQSAGQA